jgi:hypothetical protein
MKPIDKNVQIRSNLHIEVSFQDLEKQIKTSKNSPGILKTAQTTLKKIQGLWEPGILFQWFDFEIDPQTGFGRIIQASGERISLDLGHSIKFLEPARFVMVSAYTIGQTLDAASAEASSKGDLLEAYMMDLIGLTVLEKTADRVKKKVEDQAGRLGWGVSPFLSPGSVHGWKLEEQARLCTLLPLGQINVKLAKDTVLWPLKSIVAVMGIGPGYDSKKVGSTCDVCSKRDTCEKRNDY